MNLARGFGAMGIDVTWSVATGTCYIDHVRNQFVRLFLQSECTDLFYLDDDLSFDPDAGPRLFSHDVDVIGGVYPMRQGGLKFPAKRIDVNDTPDANGLMRMDYIPGGFMRISRRAIIQLCEHYPDDLYVSFDQGERQILPKLFWVDTQKLEGDDIPRLISEDAYFCYKWQGLGKQVYCDATIPFGHHGDKVWTARYADYLNQKEAA